MSTDPNETHPLLANYVEQQIEHEEYSHSERSSEITFLNWTTCDEIKRCSCAILSFILMSALVGSGLVLFWFLWAWFVLYLDLPGVLTPIVWLTGFLLPLILFKVFQSCPRCTRACFAQPLIPPDINAWKTHHLWNERRQFILTISKHSRPRIPLTISEMISDFCFHSDILVTTNKNKLVGIYPDTAQLHTVAEFSKSITDLAVANGNIHSVYVLVCREMEKTAIDCRERLGCDGGDNDIETETETETETDNNNNDNRGGFLSSLPSYIWSPKQYVDMIICEYDIAKGLLKQTSLNFNFEQISITTMQQLRGIYYKPSYRLLIDNERDIIIVHRDGDFIQFDSKTLEIISSREIISHPENRDDREQFIHLREYKWNASHIVASNVINNIITIIDSVEGTSSEYLFKSQHIYIIIPFGSHALFICNINTGWLRYLDFSHVAPISDTQIHYINFSIDGKYLYLCCTNTLSVLSTNNFQPIINIPFTKLDYTVPCGLIRTPPTQQQILLMLHKHQKLLLKTAKLKHANSLNNSLPSLQDTVSTISEDPQYTQAIKSSQETYKNTLSKKLESIAIIYASTRIFMDPRIFLYRFPSNKSRVVSHGNGKQKSVYSGGSFLIDRVTNEAPSQGVGQQWHYITMKQHRPWNIYKKNNGIKKKKRKNKKKKKKHEIIDDNFVPILNSLI